MWLDYFVICKVRVDANFTLLLYLLLNRYQTLFRKIDFYLVLEGKSSPYNIFTTSSNQRLGSAFYIMCSVIIEKWVV